MNGEKVSFQKAKAIAGEYYPLVKEGSEFPLADGRTLIYQDNNFIIIGK